MNVKRKAYIERARGELMRLLGEVEVAYDRELRYRLETQFAHDITWGALEELKSEEKVREFGLPGRKKNDRWEELIPSKFYTLPEYWRERRRELEKKAREKRELVALGVAAISEAGRYAEELFWEGVKELPGEEGWEVFPERAEDVGKDVPNKLLRERKDWVKEAMEGGPSVLRYLDPEQLKVKGGDFDFALRVGEGYVFGVEVKNGLSYPKLYGKLLSVSKLGMLPLLIVR